MAVLNYKYEIALLELEGIMEDTACAFDLTNDDQDDLTLFLEPEGTEFELRPGKTVTIRVYGSVNPMKMSLSTDSFGKKAISFWPENGRYDLLIDGENVLDKI